MNEERQVWSYVAHRDGMFAGAISGSLDEPARPATAKQAAKWKKEVAKFCGDFIVDGFTITPTYSSEEFRALTAGMPMWERPKKAPEPATPDMFAAEPT